MQVFKNAKITVKITKIAKESDKAQCLVLESGQRIWVPKSQVEFKDGNAVLPLWLYKKLLEENSNETRKR